MVTFDLRHIYKINLTELTLSLFRYFFLLGYKNFYNIFKRIKTNLLNVLFNY